MGAHPSPLLHLYRISLEPAGRWFLLIGAIDTLEDGTPVLDIHLLDAFIRGLGACREEQTDLNAFLEWLRHRSGDPFQSWTETALAKANGDHPHAIGLFFDWLHEFLVSTKPDWFLDLNKSPIPSLLVNGLGQPVSDDVRRPEHQQLAINMSSEHRVIGTLRTQSAPPPTPRTGEAHMALSRIPRIEALLGTRFDEVNEEHLARLTELASTAPAYEDADLDFKQDLYGNKDDDRRALAADVAAMANTVGGVIMLGISESNGAAAKLSPITLSDDEVLRMRSIIATLIAPAPHVEFKRVPSQADLNRGTLLVIVPRSGNAPHAVRVNDGLRYYRRDGNRNRPLSESEVAGAYRDRFRIAHDQIERLEAVYREGIEHLELGPYVWLTLTIAPNVPGLMPINRRRVANTRMWAEDYCASNPGDGPFPQQVHVGTGMRRLTFRCEPGATPAKYAYAELHEDGSGFAARQVSLLSPDVSHDYFQLIDEIVVLTAVGLLRLLAEYATIQAGTHGDAVLRLDLSWPATGTQAHRPIALGDSRRGFWRETSVRVSAPPVSKRTISMESMAANIQQRLAAFRPSLNDIFQAFGIDEVPQIDDLGRIRSQYWRAENLDTWRSGRSLPKVDRTLEEEVGLSRR